MHAAAGCAGISARTRSGLITRAAATMYGDAEAQAASARGPRVQHPAAQQAYRGACWRAPVEAGAGKTIARPPQPPGATTAETSDLYKTDLRPDARGARIRFDRLLKLYHLLAVNDQRFCRYKKPTARLSRTGAGYAGAARPSRYRHRQVALTIPPKAGAPDQAGGTRPGAQRATSLELPVDGSKLHRAAPGLPMAIAPCQGRRRRRAYLLNGVLMTRRRQNSRRFPLVDRQTHGGAGDGAAGKTGPGDWHVWQELNDHSQRTRDLDRWSTQTDGAAALQRGRIPSDKFRGGTTADRMVPGQAIPGPDLDPSRHPPARLLPAAGCG